MQYASATRKTHVSCVLALDLQYAGLRAAALLPYTLRMTQVLRSFEECGGMPGEADDAALPT